MIFRDPEFPAFFMDGAMFSELQKENCWFTLSALTPLPKIDPREDITDPVLFENDTLVQRHLFAMIFGGHGYSVNLSRAKLLATLKIGLLEKTEPKDTSPDNPAFARWIGLFAQYYVLLGTVFAYLHMDLLAAYCLMNGLKTGAINLFRPYCDFIRSVLLRVEKLPAEPAVYEGRGFSVDEPMGSPLLGGGFLVARAAEEIIPALEGDDGEIILAYTGRYRYGSVRRLGSANSERLLNCVDIYETLAIDRNFKLKKLRFYFNGYFKSGEERAIRLPKGFSLDPLNPVARYYNIIE